MNSFIHSSLLSNSLRASAPREVLAPPIWPEEDGAWSVPHPTAHGGRAAPRAPKMRIRAVEMDHTVPTVGWLLEEYPRPGAPHTHRIIASDIVSFCSRSTRRLLAGLESEAMDECLTPISPPISPHLPLSPPV